MAEAIIFLVIWYVAYIVYYWFWGYRYDLEAIRIEYKQRPQRRRKKKQSLDDLYVIEEIDSDLL
jgi:uncharacterized membrane protein YdbT with pleckstrin-like domain